MLIVQAWCNAEAASFFKIKNKQPQAISVYFEIEIRQLPFVEVKKQKNVLNLLKNKYSYFILKLSNHDKKSF